MNNTTRILIVEDDINDYELAQVEIRRVVEGCTFKRVDKEIDLLPTLQEFQPHIILSDYKLPGFDGGKVLELARQHASLAPVIIWTGALGEDIAIDCMKMGASDYVLKENTKQLGHAVIQALKERDVLLERKQAQEKYQAIFENSPIGIFQSTPQGQFLSVNPAMARIYGYASPQEMISSITDIAHQIYTSPEDRRKFTSLLETQHVVQNFEWENTRKDGSILWTATSARAVYDETGNVSYYEGFLRDITDWKLAEVKLRESEARYHGIFENAQDAIFVESFEGDILDVNQRACEMFGYTRQEFLQKKVKDIIPANGQPVYLPPDNSSLGQTIEAVNVRANGEHFPVELCGGLFEARGRRLLLIILRDITERKQAEEKLREQDKRFQVLIEHGMDNISLIAEDGTLIWEDPSLNIVLGYKRGEFIGQSLFALLHPEDLPWVTDLFTNLVHEPGKIRGATFRLKHHDGTWRWIEATATNMLDEPTVKAVVINYRDITQRKQAEKALSDSESKYRALAENSLQGIAIFQEQSLVYVNPAMCRIMGYTMDELLAMSAGQIFALTHPEDRANAQEREAKRRSGEPVSSINDVRIIRKDGEVRWIQTFINSIEYDNQPALLSTSIDISERKQAEIELQQKNDDLGLLKIVNDAVLQGQGLDSVMDLLSKELNRIFSTVGSTIYMFAADKQSLTMQQYAFSAETAHKIERLIGFAIPKIQIPIREGGYFHRAMISRQSAITSDPKDIQNWIAEFVETKFLPPIAKTVVRRLIPKIYKLLNIKSTIVVPLIFEEEIIGFLDVSSSNLFTPKDLRRIENIGEQLTTVLQRQQTTEKIRKSEEFLQGVQNSLSAHIAILDEHGGIVQVNEAWCEFGRQNGLQSTNSCIGMNYMEICESATGSDAEVARQVANAVREILAGKKAEMNVEYPCHSSEEKRWFTVHITCFDDGEQKWIILAHENITERKRAEEALRQQEQSFRTLTTNLPDIISRFDRNLKYVYANPIIAVGTGLAPESFLGKTNREAGMPEDVVVHWESALRKVFETGKPTTIEFTFPGIDTVHDFEARLVPEFSSEGNVETVLVINRDITERKHTEEALRQSEYRYRTVVESQTDFIVRWRPDGTRSFVNDAYCRYFGITREEALNSSFTPLILEEDRQMVDEKISRLLSGESRFETETHRVFTADGSIGWNEWTDHGIYDDSGRLVEFQSVGRDITERKQVENELRESEQRYHALFEDMPVAIWENDYSELKRHLDSLKRQGVTNFQEYFESHPDAVAECADMIRILDVNNAAVQMYEADSKAELIESTNREMTDGEKAHSHEVFIAMAEDRTSSSWEGGEKTLKGRPIQISLNWSVVPGYEEDYARVIVTTVDITKRKEAEAAEREQRLLAETLRDTSQILSSSLDYGEVLDRILTAVGRVVPHDSATIMLIDGGVAHVVRSQGYQKRDPNINVMDVRLPLVETTNLRQMLETKQSVVVYDTFSFPGWNRAVTTNWQRSNVGAPILVQDEVIGFILLDAEAPGFFTPVHAERLEAFANQAALAIHNANLLKQAQAEITERKRAEESLMAERKKLQDYLDIAGVMMLALDRQGSVALINQKGCEILGYSADEVIGKNWIETFVPAEIRTELLGVFESLSVGDTASSSYYENPVLTKNGEQRMIAWHNTLLRDAQGTVISTLSSGEDITERTQIEAKLQASESRYRLATQATKDVIWEWKAGTNQLLWTENAQIVLGYSPEEVGPDALWWDEHIHPEDRERVQSKLYALTALESDESVWLDEYRFLAKDGSYAYINDHAYIERDSSGKAIRMIGAMSNITERKRAEQELRTSEERFRQLATNIEEAFWMTDARTGQELYISPAAAAIWGHSVEDILNIPDAFINSVLPDDRAHVLVALERQKNGEKTEIEYRVHRPDGSIRWVWDRAFPVFDEHGNVKILAGIAADITERKQAEMDLTQSQARYQDLFDSSPISLWEEDYSLVKKRIENLQEEGVTNFEEYFSTHPDVIMELASLVKVINVNRASMELYNVRQKGELLKNLTEFVSEQTLMHFQSEVLSLMSREKFEWEGSDRALDGQKLFVLVNGSIPPGHAADWSKVIVSITDVTERRQAEERLLSSEERYHSLFQHLVDGFALHEIITDEQGKPVDYRFLEINPAFEKLTGLRAETTVGRRVNEVLPAVGNERFISIYGKVALTGEPVHFEEYSAPLGRYYEINAYSPRRGQFAVTFEDITERKQADENLRKLSRAVDQSASTIVITDIQGNIEYVNPKFTEITGYSFEEVIGKNPRILKSGHTSSDEYKQLWETITVGKEWRGELQNRKKNGDLFWELATISPIQNEHGEITHFLAVKEDISQLKQSEIETHRRADEFAALYETARDLAVQFNLPTLLKTIVERACDLLRVPGGGLYLYDEARNDLEMVLAVGSSVPIGARLKMGEGIAGRVAQTQQLLMVDDYHTWEGRSLQYEAIPFRAVLQVPMLYGGDLIGVLSVNELGDSERKYTEVDAHLLSLFAEYAASAVHAARLLQETQRRLAELEALYENGLAVGQLLEPRQIGERLIETFARHLSWHHVTIRLLRPGTDEMQLIALNLPDLDNADKIEVEARFQRLIHKVGQGLSGYVVQTGTPIRTGQVHAHPQYISTQAGIQSGVYMPLKIGSRVIGVISVESEEPDAFTEQDERLLATLATQAAIAFENARLYQAAQQEITERERAQAALRESEAHYRELADSITEIMFELDQNLNYSHWNKASELFSGITAQDAIGRSIPDVFGASEDQSYQEEIYRHVLMEQKAQTFETEVFPQNQRRILEINAYPSARGVSVVARDITERRLSEALQQKRIALMEYSAHYALDELMQRAIDEISELTDSHIGFLHFVETDQKAIQMQAWSSETLQVMGRIEEKEMHYPLESAGIWADAVRQRQPIIHNDYQSLPDKKGLPEDHVPVIRELVVPIIRDDRVAGVLGIGNSLRPYDEHDVEITERFADYAWDIIERKQMESALSDERNQLAKRVEERTADLSRANSNLARALRVKDEFLANMSHELRTPLNAILGLSESLSEQVAGPLNEKQQKYLNTINESGHHLLSLINDILDLAKIEAGQITLDINKVDINSVCQASLRMIKQLAQKKNQEVLFEIDNGLGLMWADERRLKQMIVNLLSNAVKFTPENSRLGLEVRGDQVGNRVLISVWDRGIGISTQDLDRLFRPFVQLDSGLAREATGTGLGLALVAQMARLHGGSVSVDSQVGEGSRFTIQLPWEPALAADASSRLRTTGKFRAVDIHAKKKPTILLVEDTREVVMMLVDYLEMAGFTIATAQDGIDGLEQAKLTHPDLILMDIQMPRMDGFETTQKLRLIPEFKETPIIALTALAMPNDRQRCLDAGMSEYISKPVNLKMLSKLIRAILYEKEGNPT